MWKWSTLAAGVALLAAACGGEGGKGEDRPNVDVISGLGSVSVSGAVEGYGELLYTPATDQKLDLAIGLDLRDLRALMAPAAQGRAVDWAKVNALFTDGANQVRPDGSKRPLAELADEVTLGEPGFVASVIQQGVAGTGRADGHTDNARRQVVDKGVQVLMYARGLERMAAASAAMERGDSVAARTAVDQAWATISGARDSATTTPNNGVLATALAREEDFKFQGRVARPLEASLSAAQAATERGDQGAFTKAIEDSRGYLNTIFYLSSLRYAGLAQADARESDREGHLAEGWGFYQALHADVAVASPDAARTIEAAYTRPADQPFPAALTADVFAALNNPTVFNALGIPAEFQVKPAQ